MARYCLTDHLQSSKFWLLDVGPIEPTVGPVLSPAYGFESITAPQLTLDMEEIPEGTGGTKHVVKGSSVDSITLTRGASLGDSDFYQWIVAAKSGRVGGARFGAGRQIGGVGTTYRRTLVLIHFFAHVPLAAGPAAALGATAVAGLAALGSARSGNGRASVGSAAAFGAVGAGAAAAGGMGLTLSTGTVTTLAVPARAWILHGCVPGRYKAGTDFQGSNAEVSLMELELHPSDFEEISL